MHMLRLTVREEHCIIAFGGCCQLPLAVAVQHEAYLYCAFLHVLGKVDDLLQVIVVFRVAGFRVDQPTEKRCSNVLSPAYKHSTLPLHVKVSLLVIHIHDLCWAPSILRLPCVGVLARIPLSAQWISLMIEWRVVSSNVQLYLLALVLSSESCSAKLFHEDGELSVRPPRVHHLGAYLAVVKIVEQAQPAVECNLQS